MRREDSAIIPFCANPLASCPVQPIGLLPCPNPASLFPRRRHPDQRLAGVSRGGHGCVTYFNGNMPVFIHGKDDIAAFMMITAQFCVNGNRENGVFVVYWIPIGGCSVFGSDIAWTTCKDYFALKRGGAFPKRPVCRQECALFPQHSPNHSV